MSDLLSYNGFKARVEFSADDNVFFGYLIGIDDVVSFEEKTAKKHKKAFREAVDFHIEVCKKSARNQRRIIAES
jgi:predicted HicB family RNase H-like nuclease